MSHFIGKLWTSDFFDIFQEVAVPLFDGRQQWGGRITIWNKLNSDHSGSVETSLENMIEFRLPRTSMMEYELVDEKERIVVRPHPYYVCGEWEKKNEEIVRLRGYEEGLCFAENHDRAFDPRILIPCQSVYTGVILK